MNFKFKFALLFVALWLPFASIAQADGGGKKTNVTQTSSPKKKTIQNSSKKPKATTGTINGHEWVDLGLPSGTKWASHNVGAYKITDAGDKYYWGCITISEPGTSVISHYEKDLGGDADLDAATFEYGDRWRTPSKMDFLELINECDVEYIVIDNVKGLKFTGKNGQHIFFPIYRHKGIDVEYADYLTSTPVGSGSAFRFALLYFNKDQKEYIDYKIETQKKDYGTGLIRPIIK